MIAITVLDYGGEDVTSIFKNLMVVRYFDPDVTKVRFNYGNNRYIVEVEPFFIRFSSKKNSCYKFQFDGQKYTLIIEDKE